MTYRDLSGDDQVEVLRPVALDAAAQFGLEVAALELVAHAFNTTFAVVGPEGSRHALRVNTNSVGAASDVVAQQAWQHALATESDVLVPDPLRTTAGRWYAEVDSAAFDGPLVATAASWLEGPDVGELDATAAQELGRTMARLHIHGDTWSLSDSGTLPCFETPLFGDEDLLDTAPLLTGDGRAVIRRARDVATLAFALLHAGAELRPIHADLHGANLKWSGDRLAVFDFDDAGLGLPITDLAVTTFYLRGEDPEPEQALRSGYAEVLPVPEIEPDLFEALVASRQLLLANSLLTVTTAELRGDAEQYLAVTVDRLRWWLKTGAFTRALPGR